MAFMAAAHGFIVRKVDRQAVGEMRIAAFKIT
jgi:hypothetical protein